MSADISAVYTIKPDRDKTWSGFFSWKVKLIPSSKLKGGQSMKLIIKRDQKAQTGLFGGHKGMTFLLTTRVELTPEERELVKRYKAENYTLTASPLPEGPKYTITSFMHGVSQEMKEIDILLDNEKEIKSACKNFKTLLDVMATFGGEEVFEF